MNPKRVLIVADDPLARTGLAALLDRQPGWTVVGQVSVTSLEGAAADDPLDLYQPDVVLWDLGWEPDSAAMGPLAAQVEEGPPVVALLPDEALVSDSLAAGAAGLLTRDITPERLLAALQAALAGLVIVDRDLARGWTLTGTLPPVEALTPRELDVLRLLAEGLANKTIARRLDISEHTVKFHINAILSKLAAQSRTEAVVHAIRLGLIAV